VIDRVHLTKFSSEFFGDRFKGKREYIRKREGGWNFRSISVGEGWLPNHVNETGRRQGGSGESGA